MYKIPQFHNPSQAHDCEIFGMTVRFWGNRGNEAARLRNFSINSDKQLQTSRFIPPFPNTIPVIPNEAERS